MPPTTYRTAAPARRGDRRPPAMRTISGTQCPPTMIGSVHSMHATRGRSPCGAIAAAPTRRPLPHLRARAPHCPAHPVASPTTSAVARCPRVPGSSETRERHRAACEPRAHLAIRHGAHVTELLGDDEVGPSRGAALVELVDARAGVARGGCGGRWPRVSRQRGEHVAGHRGSVAASARVIALVSDRQTMPPAPIAKRSSVALGSSETMRAGRVTRWRLGGCGRACGSTGSGSPSRSRPRSLGTLVAVFATGAVHRLFEGIDGEHAERGGHPCCCITDAMPRAASPAT